jgi:hypothetical protein
MQFQVGGGKTDDQTAKIFAITGSDLSHLVTKWH